MLTDEEVKDIKEKIISQIESTFPKEQVDNARRQIEAMNARQLEGFLERNQMIKKGASEQDSNSECVFCSIVSGKINSVKIDENDYATAVLEINPISRGHVIIIPKSHSKESSKWALSLAQKVSEKIKKKLSPKEVEISDSRVFGHQIINILPIYDKENINSKRTSATIKDLEKIKEEIEIERKKEKIKKQKTKKLKQFFWLPKRIP